MKQPRTRTEAPDGTLDIWAERVIPKAVAYTRTLVANPADAEDVVHDVLCRLLRHKEYDLLIDGEKLLYRSITNACINKWTRKRQMVSLDARTDGTSEPFAVVASRSHCDPVEQAMSREFHAAVGRALASLPSMQRAALELKILEHSLNEIAEILDVSVSNAGVLIHRARKSMAKRLPHICGQRN